MLTPDTDSVCSVNNPEAHRVANFTSGTRFSPSRFARIESLRKRFSWSPYDLLKLLAHSSLNAPIWTHAGERITLAAHVLTEREVRAARGQAVQSETERVTR